MHPKKLFWLLGLGLGSIFMLAMIGLSIALRYENELRAICESKGGVYLTARQMDSVCVRKDAIIN